ncbi:MAG: hypothetical protein WCP35_03205 [Verrucomicrobiota bacterium]
MNTTLHFTRNRAPLLLASLLLATPLAAPAQTNSSTPPPATATPPATPPAAAPAAAQVTPPAVDAPPPAAAKPDAKPDTGLAAALRTLTYERTPEALLAATRAQRKSGTPSEADNFRMAVLLGDWAGVGKTLAGLPPEDAAAGYTRLLDSLAGNASAVSDVLKAAPANAGDPYNEQPQPSDSNQGKPKPAPLLSEDFYALINAAPANLREENIPALASLVKTALGAGGKKTLLERLVKGWQGLGGTTPEGRMLATQLLSTLGWITDAAPFLTLKSEEWTNADTMQLVFAMEYFTQTGISQRDERQLQHAAEVCAHLLKNSRFGNYTRPQFRLAMDRLVQLLPALDAAAAKKLIREQLFKQTATLADLIAIIGELGQTAAKGKELPPRAASLGTQNLLLQALAEMDGPPPEIAAVLVMNWLTEAEACYRAGGAVAVEMTQAEQMMMNRYGNQGKNAVKSLPTDTILTNAPPPAILRRLNPGLAQRVELTLLKVNILQPKEANIALLREYVKAHPGLERDVCQDVLSAWVAKRTTPAESPQVKQMRAYGMYVPPQMLQAGAGIPLTRLRQNQNIQQFKSLLAQLRMISPEPIDPALVVQSFMTLHSGAEVYRLEDIEAIFGPPEKMVRAELLTLLGGMRSRLQEQWRDPKTQQQAGTNRSEAEAKDEVSRGYKTALELARRGIRAEDGDWAAFITRGQLFFDVSQYEFERQVKLSEYVNLRDEAFASFRKAAEIYAAKLPLLPRGQWTLEAYQAWFIVMLGASDLSQLTTSTARTDPGLKSIGDAMRALPGDAAQRHLEMFGKMLGDFFPRVPANVRQRFLSSGLKVVGEDHPAAKSAMTSLNYYRELLDEVQLRVTIDGPTRVGHTQPFGMFISLEATRQLLRESGGFSKYIQNPNQQKGMMGMMGPQPNQNTAVPRDDFAKNIHAALDETFEVLSLTFHDAAVKTIDLPREGWVESPLLYAVLRAKNAAVDRVPSIQIDMDFIDQPGQVVLPVMSQLLPLDAKDDAVAARPCAELALTLTMDEREWRDGKLVVEIQARGQGIIPALPELFNVQRDGFDLEPVDSNLSVSQFVSDGSRKSPHADRNWQLTYRRHKDLRGDVTFPFPMLQPGIQPASIEYKHYQDADLVAIDAKQAAAGIPLVSHVSNAQRNTLLLTLLAAVLIATILFLRRKLVKTRVITETLAIPAQLTPFTAVAFLRRIQHHHAARLGSTQLSALATQIAELETGYFSSAQAPTLDLTALTTQWLRAVR